jgi:hypothetical protein
MLALAGKSPGRQDVQLRRRPRHDAGRHAAGADVIEIVHCDPAAVGVEAMKAFSFRNMVSRTT